MQEHICSHSSLLGSSSRAAGRTGGRNFGIWTQTCMQHKITIFLQFCSLIRWNKITDCEYNLFHHKSKLEINRDPNEEEQNWFSIPKKLFSFLVPWFRTYLQSSFLHNSVHWHISDEWLAWFPLMEVAQLPGCCVSWRQLDRCNRLWRNDRRTPRHWPVPRLVQCVMEPSTSSLPPPSTTRADTVKAFAENRRASYRRHYPQRVAALRLIYRFRQHECYVATLSLPRRRAYLVPRAVPIHLARARIPPAPLGSPAGHLPYRCTPLVPCTPSMRGYLNHPYP
jgi:hypothetical protein